MIDKVAINQCVLCKACANACPANAIQFLTEYKGFYYPSIDRSACISCERCEAACPICQPARNSEPKEPIGYAAMHNNNDIRRQSTSGGVFSSTANYVLAQGGFVCGAVLDEHFSVKHIVSNDPPAVAAMRGSKYAQSDLGTVFSEIAVLVNQDTPVLFTGCPCQVAALRSFLNQDYPNLYTIDLICHGTPSNSLLQSYLTMMETKYHSKALSLNFRDKTNGWHRSGIKIKFESGRSYFEPFVDNAYAKGLLSNITLKEVCYNCPFKGGRAGSDITLGDFWGAEIELPQMDDNKGLSAVLIHTDKGQHLFDNLEMTKHRVKASLILQWNRFYLDSSCPNPLRQDFFEYASAKGNELAIKKYLCEKLVAKTIRKSRFLFRRVRNYFAGKKTIY